jgi:hypothetical protein
MTGRLFLPFLLASSLLGTAPAALAAPNAAREGRAVPLQYRVARALYPRERWKREVKAASDRMTDRIAERGDGHFELSPEFRDRLRQEYEAMVPYEELVAYQAGILSSTYSHEELRKLLAFCESPTGQKSIRFLNELVRDADNQLQIGLLQRLPGALQRLRPLVRQLEPSEERQGAPPTASATSEGDWQ